MKTVGDSAVLWFSTWSNSRGMAFCSPRRVVKSAIKQCFGCVNEIHDEFTATCSPWFDRKCRALQSAQDAIWKPLKWHAPTGFLMWSQLFCGDALFLWLVDGNPLQWQLVVCGVLGGARSLHRDYGKAVPVHLDSFNVQLLSLSIVDHRNKLVCGSLPRHFQRSS